MAIIQFLVTAFGLGILPPSPPHLLAAIWQFSEVINSGTQPLQNFTPMKLIKEVREPSTRWT